MKRLIAATVTLMVLFGVTLTGMAQTAPSASTPAKAEAPPLSPEDVKKLREGAQDLLNVLSGKKAESASATAAKKEEPPQKNMADIADRALSIMSGYISSAEQAFKKVAPEVWRVMIRQQYANAVAGLILPVALIFFITIFVVVVKRWWEEPKQHDDEWWGRFWVTNIIPMVLYFAFGIWAANMLSNSIQMLINPEYYAFRDLLRIVLNKGGL